MKDIDRYAYYSQLRFICPTQKVLLALTNLCLALLTESAFLLTLLLLFMSYLTLVRGKTPFKIYSQLMCIPLSFLLLSLIAIVFEWGSPNTPFLYSLTLGSIRIGVTSASLFTVKVLFFRVLCCISCLYFLCLSTPMVDLFMVLRKLRCPPILIELMNLIYRFIFVLIDIAYTMQVAQSTRLGYINLRTSLKSLGMLFSTLLVRALKTNDLLYTALEARGYTGELNVLNDIFYTRMSIIKIITIELLFILILIGTKGWF